MFAVGKKPYFARNDGRVEGVVGHSVSVGVSGKDLKRRPCLISRFELSVIPWQKNGN